MFKAVALTASVFLWTTAPARSQPSAPDTWESVRVLVGDWVGSADGKTGAGTVRRSYSFILDGAFLHENTTSTYAPQPAGVKGATHRHWGLFSYDREREKLVLRRFRQDGIVSEYVMNTSASAPGKLVFESERFENLGKEWRARETFEILSPDEFTETSELAEHRKKLKVTNRTHFKRYNGEHCADNKTLTELTDQYGSLVLCAANDVVAGADSVCTAIFPEFWQSYDPEFLAERTPPAAVAAGLDWVCASVLSLPTGPDVEVMKQLGAWCALNRWIYSLADRGAEAMATAVAVVPATADLLAESIAERGIAKEDIGESLASGEHTELRYALTRRLVSMPEETRVATLLALSDETNRAARRGRGE